MAADACATAAKARALCALLRPLRGVSTCFPGTHAWWSTLCCARWGCLSALCLSAGRPGPCHGRRLAPLVLPGPIPTPRAPELTRAVEAARQTLPTSLGPRVARPSGSPRCRRFQTRARAASAAACRRAARSRALSGSATPICAGYSSYRSYIRRKRCGLHRIARQQPCTPESSG